MNKGMFGKARGVQRESQYCSQVNGSATPGNKGAVGA